MSDNLPNPKEKFGAQKPDLSLIPPVAKLHMAMAFENGAGKYGPFNWRGSGVEARTYIAAAQRHLDNYLDGEENATNSGVHNLGHVMACCAILLDAASLGKLLDNRPQPGKSSEVQEELKAQQMLRAAKQAETTTVGVGTTTAAVPEPTKHGWTCPPSCAAVCFFCKHTCASHMFGHRAKEPRCNCGCSLFQQYP